MSATYNNTAGRLSRKGATVALLTGMSGTASERGVISLRALVAGRPVLPFYLENGANLDLDFAVARVSSNPAHPAAARLRCDGARVLAYEYPRITLEARGTPSASQWTDPLPD